MAPWPRLTRKTVLGQNWCPPQNKPKSVPPANLMCGLGKHPSILGCQPSSPSVPVWIPQIKGLGTAVCQKRQALYFLAVFVSSSCCQPFLGNSNVMVFSSRFFFFFWRVWCVFVDPRSPILDCNGIAYLKTLRDLRCIYNVFFFNLFVFLL